jgi:hypothetical protein
MDIGHEFERLQDYTADRLSDDERLAFEQDLVSDPGLVRELEHSLRLREALRHLREQGKLPRAKSWIAPARIWLPVMAAAGVAGVALLLRMQVDTKALPVLTATLQPPGAVTAHFTFVATRESSTPDLALPASGVMEFRAAPQRLENSRYRMTLVRQEDAASVKPVAVVSDLSMHADGYVYAYADAARLTPGRYVLRIEPEAGTAGTTESFAFNLRRANP